jgi:AcrR family transcriptional regulator
MGRRSDHTRAELEALIIEAAHRHMAQAGYALFSARHVAREIGYSVGTIYNVIGSHNRLILTLNGVTLDQWSDVLTTRLERVAPEDDRIAALVEGYFEFAQRNPKLWSALYEHHLPEGEVMPPSYREKLERLLGVITGEVQREIGADPREQAASLSHSLIASVHGHCAFALNGAFALMGGEFPMRDAYARVREAIEAQKGRAAARVAARTVRRRTLLAHDGPRHLIAGKVDRRSEV